MSYLDIIDLDMSDWVCGASLRCMYLGAGSASEFKKKYEVPILNSRDADATDSVHQKGKERLEELLTLVNKCIIRRTQALLTKYLPVKSE